MVRSKLVPVAVALLAVAAAGCAGTGGDASVARAEQVRGDAVASVANVSTYTMSMRMTVDTERQTVNLSMTGASNHTAREARFETTIRGRTVRTYVDGTTAYVEGPRGWQTRNVSARDPWNRGNALDRQREILADADIERLGNATVDGEPVYVLEVSPKPSRVREVVSSQQQQSYGDVSLENVTYRQFVHRDTGRLVEVRMEMAMAVRGRTAHVSMTIAFDDYGDPVNVTVPDDAPGTSA